jgi:hypothetical protein
MRENVMRTSRLWRQPRTRPRRCGVRGHRGPRSRAARYVLLACCASLAALTGVVQLAGPAQAVPSRWSVTPAPNRGTGTDQLSGVSCPGSKFCMAVGNFGGGIATLTAAWNGRAWSIIPSPTPRGSVSPVGLSGVSCTSSSFCVAVGEFDSRSSITNKPLVETWNGKAWSITPTPGLSGTAGNDSGLLGVSCLSATRCVAVGDRGSLSQATATLVESWNGKAWSVIPSPSIGSNSVLNSISCRSAASCVAVGSHDGAFGMLTLAESWNGSRWSVIPSPNVASRGNNWFSGVSCPSATDCEAVGGWNVQPVIVRNLAESWNGKRWSVVTIPSRGPLANDLGGVSCTSASNCVTAGFNVYGPASGPGNGKTLIESWNGSRWAITPSPSPRADSELYAVACTSAASCEAVGFAGKGSLVSDRTLVETGS